MRWISLYETRFGISIPLFVAEIPIPVGIGYFRGNIHCLWRVTQRLLLYRFDISNNTRISRSERDNLFYIVAYVRVVRQQPYRSGSRQCNDCLVSPITAKRGCAPVGNSAIPGSECLKIDRRQYVELDSSDTLRYRQRVSPSSAERFVSSPGTLRSTY